jgi:hypothetical protein
MKKQILALVCTAALTLSLTSCDTNYAEVQQSGTPYTTATDTTDATATGRSTATSGDALQVPFEQLRISAVYTDLALPEPPPLTPSMLRASAPDADGVRWLVRPTSSLRHIWFCNICNGFYDGSNGVIDERTGVPTGNHHTEHCGDLSIWFYDPVLDVFGNQLLSGWPPEMRIIDPSEFAEHFPFAAERILAVQKVDSALRQTTDYPDECYYEFLAQEAFSGEYAAMFNGYIFTDFEFEAVESGDATFGRNGTRAAFRRDSRYGVIGHDGEIIVPFIFERLYTIDDYSAFAKVGSRWGIIAFEERIPNRRTTGGFNFALSEVPIPGGAYYTPYSAAYVDFTWTCETFGTTRNWGNSVLVSRGELDIQQIADYFYLYSSVPASKDFEVVFSRFNQQPSEDKPVLFSLFDAKGEEIYSYSETLLVPEPCDWYTTYILRINANINDNDYEMFVRIETRDFT